MSKVALDTNAYSNLLKGNKEVFEILSTASEVYISVVVLGELLTGFKGGNTEEKNIEILNRFLGKPRVALLEVTRETSEIFAELKHQLRANGTPIPINDVWISAHAIEKGARLVTFDRHFEQVVGLRRVVLGV